LTYPYIYKDIILEDLSIKHINLLNWWKIKEFM
jgi:hypothetical protein